MGGSVKKEYVRGITSFEDLTVYQKARQFRVKIYKLVKNLPKKEEYNLINQMRRAALSLTNNLAEGYGRYHYQENIQFCRQARGSAYEIIDDLNCCIDEDYIPKDEHQGLKAEAYELIKLLNAYISRTKELKTTHEPI